MEVIYIQVPPCWLDFFEITYSCFLARTISIYIYIYVLKIFHLVSSLLCQQTTRGFNLRVTRDAFATRSEVGSADVVADRIANIEKQKDGNFTTEVGRKNPGG